MALKKHQQFRLDADKKWTEKWFKFIISHKNWYGFSDNWQGVSANPNITMKFIEEHPEYKWNWHWVSYNSNLTRFIEAHLDYEGIEGEVSRNSNITRIY